MSRASSLLVQLKVIGELLAEKDAAGESAITVIERAVSDLVAGFTAADLTEAIADIKARQAVILGAGTLRDLPSDELAQYSGLGDARLILASRQLVADASHDFGRWLVEDALPVLLRILPIVLPLLL